MPNIDGKEYPRLENGVVIQEPQEKPAPSFKAPSGLNINEASADDLNKIKGVGQKVATAIVEEREESGPFLDLADCSDRVSGITVKSLSAAGAHVGN